MYSRLFQSRHLASKIKLARIFHITDIEGCGSFFRRAIKNSSIVYIDNNDKLQFHKGRGTPYFICGGDVDDRGNEGLAILKSLLDFKQRHPENVILLVGNREIKNCRLKTELHPEHIRDRLLYTESPRWLNHKTYPKDYVINSMKSKSIDITNQQAINDYVRKLSINECQLIYLHWMLEKTLGSPHAFRYRREELARMNEGNSITDIDVLNSFIQETSPTGLMGQYLSQGHIGALIPGTSILAIHGGLTSQNIGRMPLMKPESQRIKNVTQWISTFNEWYRKQISIWQHNVNADQITMPACTELDESVLPISGKFRQIMIADMLGTNRTFTPISDTVSQYLQDNNISVILTGHQPSGDHPALVRDKENKILFINGDTGYANFDSAHPDNTRGMASHATDIFATPYETRISITATISNNAKVKTDLTINKNGISDPCIGHVLPDNRLVQCALSNNNYRLIEQNGHQIRYTIMSKSELLKLLPHTDKNFCFRAML